MSGDRKKHFHNAQGDGCSQLAVLGTRAHEIFHQLVETFIATGSPVGARTISNSLEESLSPATVRNVMQDLEEAGLLSSPHHQRGTGADRNWLAIVCGYHAACG